MSKAIFNRNKLTLELEMGNGLYTVELEQCTDSAGMLDAILQVVGHRCCTLEILSDFMKCLNETCLEMHGETVQALFCPCGFGRKVKWRK